MTRITTCRIITPWGLLSGVLEAPDTAVAPSAPATRLALHEWAVDATTRFVADLDVDGDQAGST